MKLEVTVNTRFLDHAVLSYFIKSIKINQLLSSNTIRMDSKVTNPHQITIFKADRYFPIANPVVFQFHFSLDQFLRQKLRNMTVALIINRALLES